MHANVSKFLRVRRHIELLKLSNQWKLHRRSDTMTDSFDEEQRELAQLWKKARKDGCMTPWQQARAYGLNEAWTEMHGEATYGKLKWISDRVYVQGPGQKHPSTEAIRQLIDKMTQDDDWFPGKVYGGLGGRPCVLTETNKSIVATSAMAMKERGIEPTYALIIAQCPNASINPNTGEPVSKQVVYDILESRCYDIDPDTPWCHQKRLAKTAVLPQDFPKRLAFGKHMLSLRHTPRWYWQHVTWTDICNSVLPLTVRKANAQALAQKGGSGWISADAKHETINMRGQKHELVLAGKECVRIYWMPVLARGKLHIELLGSGFAGDHVDGMATFVHKLKASLNTRFRNDQPTTVFVDMGGGFYQGGIITHEFKTALREHGLKAFHGDDASFQPGHSGDLWLHETAVAWVRHRLRRTLPAEPWRETLDEFESRLKAAAAYVNENHDVDGLCKEMPQRMRDLVHVAKGGRLNK